MKQITGSKLRIESGYQPGGITMPKEISVSATIVIMDIHTGGRKRKKRGFVTDSSDGLASTL